MARLLTSLCAILVLLGALASAQDNPVSQVANRQAAQRRLRNRQPQPQNPADFSPDPPPVPAQPVIQPVAAQAPGPVAQAAQPVPAPQTQPAETLPPPTAAQVTYRNNMLTVQATNSTLAGLLIAIRNKTGIQFEGLESATERVAISMGPAPEGEVLAAILGGSKYDYVVVERPDSPGIVQRVLLSARASGVPTAPGAAPAPVTNNGEGDDEDSTDEAENPQDTPVRPPITQAQPQQQPIQPPQAKTPEQLLEELKRMQQQQQQQQGQVPPQQNSPVKSPPIPQ